MEFIRSLSREMIVGICSFPVVFAGLLLVRRSLLRYLIEYSKHTKTQIDDIIIGAIEIPSIMWSLLGALYAALMIMPLPADISVVAGKVLMVVVIFSFTMAGAKIVDQSLNHLVINHGHLPAFISTLASVAVYLVGLLIILNNLGVAIAPILATLGVGGLAVALALQDTLSNLFAGFYMLISKQVRIGEYVKLESGEEGYVTDINWRSTRIRMLSNNTIIVPNDRIIKSVITNYHFPETELAVTVEVGVHYDSDLAVVERVVSEVAREVMNTVEGGISGANPAVRFHTFADSSINFTVAMRAREFVDQYLIKHEFIKRLHVRFNKEGIIIPYPIRTIEQVANTSCSCGTKK